jgi:hypothetical protein
MKYGANLLKLKLPFVKNRRLAKALDGKKPSLGRAILSDLSLHL